MSIVILALIVGGAFVLFSYNNAFKTHALEWANLKCQQYLVWIPTFLKVYIIGILETLYIVIYKRGLLPNSTTCAENEARISNRVAEYRKKNKGSQVAVMTGADSGIGLEVAKGLLEAGFHVIIGTRSKDLCKKVFKPFIKGNKISILELELANFDSVHDFASQVNDKLSNQKIDLLINNAGVMNVPYLKTVDGFESQCQINFISPVLLTQLLLPCMNIMGSKILFASSSTLYAINNLNTATPLEAYTLNGLKHYAYSKSCIAQLAHYLSTQIPPEIKVYSYHPGTVRTKLFNHTNIFTCRLFSKLFDLIMLTPREGSQTPLRLCLSDEIGNQSNYWADERPQALVPIYVDGELNCVSNLWQDTLIKSGYMRKVADLFHHNKA